MTAPTVVVCVPYRARNDHDAALQAWTEARWSALHPTWAYIVADADPSAPFNRSASRNAAAQMAAQMVGEVDVLCFANSDTVPLIAAEVVTAVTIAADGGWTLPTLYVEQSRRWTDDVLAMEPGAELPDPLSGYDRQLLASPAGPQIVGRAAFETVGGWDEQFGSSWAYEDAAFRDALDVLTVSHVRVGTACHLWHARTHAMTVRDRGVMANRQRWTSLYRRAAAQRDPAQRVAMMRRAIGT